MKKKIGTIIDDKLWGSIKQRAAAEDRPLADLIEEAPCEYLGRVPGATDRLRMIGNSFF